LNILWIFCPAKSISLLFPLIVADYDLNASRKFVRWDY